MVFREHPFGEVFVVGNEDPFLGRSEGQNFAVGNPLGGQLNRMASLAQDGNQAVVDVFVKQKLHKLSETRDQIRVPGSPRPHNEGPP